MSFNNTFGLPPRGNFGKLKINHIWQFQTRRFFGHLGGLRFRQCQRFFTKYRLPVLSGRAGDFRLKTRRNRDGNNINGGVFHHFFPIAKKFWDPLPLGRLPGMRLGPGGYRGDFTPRMTAKRGHVHLRAKSGANHTHADFQIRVPLPKNPQTSITGFPRVLRPL